VLWVARSTGDPLQSLAFTPREKDQIEKKSSMASNRVPETGFRTNRQVCAKNIERKKNTRNIGSQLVVCSGRVLLEKGKKAGAVAVAASRREGKCNMGNLV
jgi:hypothetical protein